MLQVESYAALTSGDLLELSAQQVIPVQCSCHHSPPWAGDLLHPQPPAVWRPRSLPWLRASTGLLLPTTVRPVYRGRLPVSSDPAPAPALTPTPAATPTPAPPLTTCSRYTSGGGGDRGCQYDLSSKVPVVGLQGYDTLAPNRYIHQPKQIITCDHFPSQSQVMSHLATVGPLAVAVDATRWSQYSAGVYSGCRSVLCRGVLRL